MLDELDEEVGEVAGPAGDVPVGDGEKPPRARRKGDLVEVSGERGDLGIPGWIGNRGADTLGHVAGLTRAVSDTQLADSSKAGLTASPN